MKFYVVYATPEHIDELVPLLDAYRVFYDQPSDPETSRSFLLDRLENQESVVYMALNDKGRGIGFVQLSSLYSSVTLRRIWMINDLYVMPYARRQGVAQTLLERVLQHAEETESKELQLIIPQENVAARQLYEKLGYIRDEDYDHFFLTVDTE